MAHFSSYNSSEAATNQAALLAGASIILGPIQTDKAQRIAGSIFTDQPGTLYIEQSYDGGNNYDVSSVMTVAATGGTITTGVGSGFNIDIVAPIVRIRYVNGGTNQGVLRLFSRTFASGG